MVTMGCNEACPCVPGLARQDWPVPDPKGQSIARVRVVRDEIRGQVTELIRQLTGAAAPSS